MMTDAIGKVSLTEDINLFVNNTLAGMVNSLGSIGLYPLVYAKFTQNNPDLVGAPVTSATDQSNGSCQDQSRS